MQPVNESGPEQDEPDNASDGQQPAPAPNARLLGTETEFHFGGTDVIEGRRGHNSAPRTFLRRAASRTNGSVSRMPRSRCFGKSMDTSFFTRPGLAARTRTCSLRNTDS